jgi:hypothetical protein
MQAWVPAGKEKELTARLIRQRNPYAPCRTESSPGLTCRAVAEDALATAVGDGADGERVRTDYREAWYRSFTCASGMA